MLFNFCSHPVRIAVVFTSVNDPHLHELEWNVYPASPLSFQFTGGKGNDPLIEKQMVKADNLYSQVGPSAVFRIQYKFYSSLQRMQHLRLDRETLKPYEAL